MSKIFQNLKTINQGVKSLLEDYGDIDISIDVVNALIIKLYNKEKLEEAKKEHIMEQKNKIKRNKEILKKLENKNNKRITKELTFKYNTIDRAVEMLNFGIKIARKEIDKATDNLAYAYRHGNVNSYVRLVYSLKNGIIKEILDSKMYDKIEIHQWYTSYRLESMACLYSGNFSFHFPRDLLNEMKINATIVKTDYDGYSTRNKEITKEDFEKAILELIK